jgi:hypothetical protein
LADQTVRIEKDDVASTAYLMASNLWIQEYNQTPKLSDAGFVCLVYTCTAALTMRTNSSDIRIQVAEIVAKK